MSLLIYEVEQKSNTLKYNLKKLNSVDPTKPPYVCLFMWGNISSVIQCEGMCDSLTTRLTSYSCVQWIGEANVSYPFDPV